MDYFDVGFVGFNIKKPTKKMHDDRPSYLYANNEQGVP